MSQKVFIPLEDVRVASPCHANWDMMDGNDRSKFCGSCQKNVYNLSEMTRFDAEELIAQHEGSLCVRYYQRADGTILTQDCPIGLAKARHTALAPWRWLAGGVAALFAWGVVRVLGGEPPLPLQATQGAPSYSPRQATVGNAVAPEIEMGKYQMPRPKLLKEAATLSKTSVTHPTASPLLGEMTGPVQTSAKGQE